MPIVRTVARGARSMPRSSRRYRSGVRPLEDRVTMSASGWSDLDADEAATLLAGTSYTAGELIVALQESSPTFAEVLAIEAARDALTAAAVTGQTLLDEGAGDAPALYRLSLDVAADFAETLAAISNWTSVEWVSPNFEYGQANPPAAEGAEAQSNPAVEPVQEAYTFESLIPSGTLDTTFDADGLKTIESTFGASDSARDVARQADGKLVVVGFYQTGSLTTPVVRRYNVDGTLDASFGVGGTVEIPNQNRGDIFRLFGVEIAADGKIVVGGDDGTMYLARFNTDGTLDTTFDGDGIRTFDPPGSDVSSSGFAGVGFTLQADGKPIIVHYHYKSGSFGQAAIARFTVSGAIDTTFNGTGYHVLPLNTGTQVPQDVAVHSDGKIVMIGTLGSPTGNDFFATRFNSNGTLDTTFDGDGTAVINVGAAGSADDARRVLVQADGKVLIAGMSAGDFGLVRLNTDGTLDTTFDGDGKVVTVTPSNDAAYALALQSDGKIVVGGTFSAELGIVRYTSAGALDTTFDGDGTATYSVGSTNLERFYGLLVQPDGRIVAVGDVTTIGGSAVDFVVARVTSSGALDTSFAGTGFSVANLGRASAQASNAIVLPDGRMLVAGVLPINGNSDSGQYAVWRLLSNGTLDTTFGVGGVAIQAVSGNWDTTGLFRQSDGKILVLDGLSDRIVRLTADGLVDASFGTAGIVSVSSQLQSEATVLVRPDDSLFVVGHQRNSTTNAYEFAVLKLTAAGAVDTSFGSGGRVMYDVGPGHDTVTTGALTADGKIILAGNAAIGAVSDFALMRLNTDGTLDTTFSGDGMVITTVHPSSETPRSVLVDADGTITVAGEASGAWAIVRYTAAGELDTTFGVDGIVTTNPGASFDPVVQLVKQADGRLIVVGEIRSSSGPSAAAARFLADGTIDTTLDGVDGMVTIQLSFNSKVLGGALQPDGRLLVLGQLRDGARGDAAIYRFLTEETLTGPPAVAGVYVRGSTWTPSYLGHLDANGLGTAGLGYALDGGATQLSTTVPWNNVDRITVRFDRNVVASIGSLVLVNSAGDTIAPTAFRYLDGRTVEFTVPVLGTDKYLIHIASADVTGIDDLALDGEWETSVTSWTAGSGDGTAGGDFNFRFNVLPGDFDSSGSVAFGEIGQARLKLGQNTSTPDYNYRQDYDGSGSITFGEIGQARGRLGSGLSALAEPPVPPDSSNSTEAIVSESVADQAFVGESFSAESFTGESFQSWVVSDSFSSPKQAEGDSTSAMEEPLDQSAYEPSTISASVEVETAAAELTGDFGNASSAWIAGPIFSEPTSVARRSPIADATPLPPYVAPSPGRLSANLPFARFERFADSSKIDERFGRFRAEPGPAERLRFDQIVSPREFDETRRLVVPDSLRPTVSAANHGPAGWRRLRRQLSRDASNSTVSDGLRTDEVSE